jgi:hypothetical protein
LLTINEISAKAQRLRGRYAERDSRMRDITAIRRGDAVQVAPHLFPEEFPRQLVANFIDVSARDTAESMADLPAFNCSASNMVSDRARSFADKRTKILNYYVEHSELAVSIVTGADRFLSYGMVPILVEPDFDAACPRFTFLDSIGSYPEMDRWGRCVSLTRVFSKTCEELCAEYPDLAGPIKGGVWTKPDTRLDVFRYVDADEDVLFLPSRENLILGRVDNPLGKCPVVVAQRPDLEEIPRGQYDDVIWIQLARAKFALLALEASEKSVQAPLAVPDDVQEVAFGPDALLQTRNPRDIHRVGVEVPQAAFAELATLNNEMRLGSRYPEGRSGEIDASIVTGRGVQELMAGFDSQIKTAQTIFQVALRVAAGLALEMDQRFWPDAEKTIRGTQDGTPYEIKYIPSKDIKGDYTCEVQYGMLGLDKNRALVFFLQCLGAGLVSKDLVRRHMPFPLDVTQEEQRIDVEEMRDALKAGVAALSTAIPQMAVAGQNPTMIVRALAEVVKRRQKGDALEDIIQDVLAPEEPPPAPEVPAAPSRPEAPSASGPLAPESMAGGPPQGGPPPDLQTLLAGLTSSGAPNLGATVSRQRPAA